MKKLTVIMAFLALIPTIASAGPEKFRISVSQFVEHPALDAVLKGFRDYLEERRIPVEYNIHNAQANMASAAQIASQIMGENPDMIVAIATPTAQACAQALKKSPRMRDTPFLFTAVTDPVDAGLVENLNRPGKNITGVSDLIPVDKHMENVKKIVPDLKKLAVLYNAGEANSKTIVRMIKESGKKMDFEVVEAAITKSSEVYQAAKGLVGRADAVFVPTDNTVVSALESAIKVCAQNRLPLIAADVDSVKRGAVAAMGFDYYKHGRQTGAMAERVLLHGAKVSETPVETQRELQLHLNLKYAELMGVKIPPELISAADKVYEK